MPSLVSAARWPDRRSETAGEPRGAFELSALVRRCMDDRALAAMLLETFTTRLPMAVAEIQRLVDEQDWRAARFKVHELKGEAGSVAAVGLHAAAAELEDCLRGERHGESPARLARVQAEAALCLDHTGEVLAELGSDLVPPPHQSR